MRTTPAYIHNTCDDMNMMKRIPILFSCIAGHGKFFWYINHLKTFIVYLFEAYASSSSYFCLKNKIRQNLNSRWHCRNTQKLSISSLEFIHLSDCIRLCEHTAARRVCPIINFVNISSSFFIIIVIKCFILFSYCHIVKSQFSNQDWNEDDDAKLFLFDFCVFDAFACMAYGTNQLTLLRIASHWNLLNGSWLNVDQNINKSCVASCGLNQLLSNNC